MGKVAEEMDELGGISGKGGSINARNEEELGQMVKEIKESGGWEHRASSNGQKSDHLSLHFLTLVQRSKYREKRGTS